MPNPQTWESDEMIVPRDQHERLVTRYPCSEMVRPLVTAQWLVDTHVAPPGMLPNELRHGCHERHDTPVGCVTRENGRCVSQCLKAEVYIRVESQSACLIFFRAALFAIARETARRSPEVCCFVHSSRARQPFSTA